MATAAPAREAPDTSKIQAVAKRQAAEQEAAQSAFYGTGAQPPGDPPRAGPLTLRPLSASRHQVEAGMHQHRHFIDCGTIEYATELLGPDATRLLTAVNSMFHEYDRAELRVPGRCIIECVVMRGPEGELRLHEINRIEVAQAIEPQIGTGKARPWWSGDHRRWCVLDGTGAISAEGFTHRATAEHAANARNLASAPTTLSGR